MRFKGICHICGEHDTGKTLASIGACHPKRIAFFHNDVKSPGLSPDSFGLYVDLASMNLTYLQTMEHVLSLIEGIKPGEFDGIIFDTWSRIGAALISYGKLNATKFRENQTMSAGQVYRWGQEWQEGRWYEASVISKLNQLAPYVCLVTHLSDHYLSGVKTGKEVPDCSETLDRVCNLRLWLRHNRDSGVPVALVLKRPSLTRITETGLEVVNYLPRKLKPLPGEKSIWDIMDRYRENPIDTHIPTEDEEPNEFELSILDGVLTGDQKEVWQANLREKEQQAKVERELLDNHYQEVKELVLSMRGQPLPVIYEAIKHHGEAYDIGFIVKTLNGE
jgi:hypothetical protein